MDNGNIENYFETIFNALPSAIAILDDAGRIETVNAAWRRFAVENGAALECVCEGVNYLAVCESVKGREMEDAHAFSQGIRAVILGKQSRFSYEYPCQTSQKKHWFIGTVMLLPESVPSRVLIMHENITERKHASRERASLEAQLQQSQKMECIGRLAGGMAHDFNNVVGVILGYSEMSLGLLNPSEPMWEYLKEIHGAAERSANLVRQLLAFARKQTIVPRNLNLNTTLEGMLKFLRQLVGENIFLDWRPGAELWMVCADPSQIDQIMANLCVNARDAISDVGKIMIATRNIAWDPAFSSKHPGIAPGNYVEITVTDSGCGIEKGILEYIFEPFFTTKSLGKGSGLGLATVYGIVRQNNGYIFVESEPNVGSTFSIYLPQSKESATNGAVVCLTVSGHQGSETILLVEDDLAMLKITAVLLENQGYTVLTAITPLEAMNLIMESGDSIALLLTDLIMPDMNGKLLAEKTTSLYPKIKCIIMSGYSTDIIAGHDILVSDFHFMEKPFTPIELITNVRYVLDKQ